MFDYDSDYECDIGWAFDDDTDEVSVGVSCWNDEGDEWGASYSTGIYSNADGNLSWSSDAEPGPLVVEAGTSPSLW